jgi:hypothetical protein
MSVDPQRSSPTLTTLRYKEERELPGQPDVATVSTPV